MAELGEADEAELQRLVAAEQQKAQFTAQVRGRDRGDEKGGYRAEPRPPRGGPPMSLLRPVPSQKKRAAAALPLGSGGAPGPLASPAVRQERKVWVVPGDGSRVGWRALWADSRELWVRIVPLPLACHVPPGGTPATVLLVSPPPVPLVPGGIMFSNVFKYVIPSDPHNPCGITYLRTIER